MRGAISMLRSAGRRTAWASFAMLLATAATAQAPAQLAQLYPGNPLPPVLGPMPPQEVDAMVRSLGLRPVGPPRIRGPLFLVDAIGQQGALVRVVIDRQSGRVTEIVQLGHGAPQVARLPLPDYDDADDDEYRPSFSYEDDDDVLLVPRGDIPPARAPHAAPGSEPRIITREDIHPDPRPLPNRPGPGVIPREGDITGSVAPQVPSAPLGVDPLLGVPPEFRGQSPASTSVKQPQPQPKTATRPSPPRVVPLPPKRPAEAPSVARRDAPSLPSAEPPSRGDDPQSPDGESSGATSSDAQKSPPVQGFD